MNSILIVARNNMHLTVKTVNSALAQDVPVEILVVDNASADGTKDWLRAMTAKYDNVHGIIVTQQKSLAACWNLGLKEVWRRGGEHALVLNNDVVLSDNTYGTLKDHQYSCSECGEFVTTVSVDNEEQFVRVNNCAQLHYDARPHPNFSGFLIRKSCWDKVGAFNESYYPAYCEDAEYHVRMHRAGVRAVCIDLPMLHLSNGANTLRYADPAEANLIKRGADANRDRFLERYGCKPGEPAYDDLFADATFGIDSGVR